MQAARGSHEGIKRRATFLCGQSRCVSVGCFLEEDSRTVHI